MAASCTTFLDLVSSLKASKDQAELLENVNNVVTFVDEGGLVEVIYQSPQSASQEVVLQLVSKLPDIVANHTADAHPSLSPSQFYTQVSRDVYTMLSKFSDQVSLDAAATLVSNVVLSGGCDSFVSVTLQHISDGFRCSRCLLSCVRDSIVDPVVTKLIQKAMPCYTRKCTIWNALGEVGVSRLSFKYILTHKNIFVRYYKKPIPLYNISSYLLCSDDGCRELVQVLYQLVELWTDKVNLQYLPQEQHVYITQAIVLFATCCLQRDIKHLNHNRLMVDLVAGISAHFESTSDSVRLLGQIVAECVLGKLNVKQGKSLKMDEITVSDVGLVERIRPLSYALEQQEKNFNELLSGNSQSPSLPPHSLVDSLKEELIDRGVEGQGGGVEGQGRGVEGQGRGVEGQGRGVEGQRGGIEGQGRGIEGARKTVQDKQKDTSVHLVSGESDSDDDDLTPYPMPEETDEEGPHYIRDCLEDLIQRESVEKYERALKQAKHLVQKSLNLSEVAMEMTKILIHLIDSYETEKFDEYRMETLVAIATRCPQKVCEYIAEELYKDNYSLRQRIDMLDVLATSAQSLAAADKATPLEAEPILHGEALERKTRRFPSSKPLLAKPNRFASVATQFFFPLLSHFQSAPKHVREDALFLGKLFYTFGIIVYSSINLPMIQEIVHNLLEFVLPFNSHPDKKVREAILFCCQVGLAVLPPELTDSSEYFERAHDILMASRASDIELFQH